MNWRAIAAFMVTVAVNVYLALALKDVFWHSMPIFNFFIYILFSIPQLLVNWGGG